MGKSHNGNHTRGNFLIHSTPKAIDSVLVISLRCLEGCIMPKLTAGLLDGFCFSYFKIPLSPWMWLALLSFIWCWLWGFFYLMDPVCCPFYNADFYHRHMLLFVECVEFIPSLHRQSFIDVTYRGKVKVNTACGYFLLLFLLFAAVLSGLGHWLTFRWRNWTPLS